MRIEFVTAVALMIVMMAAGAIDLWAYATHRNTVSSVIQGWCRMFPVLPFAAGMLAFHLFCQP